MKTFFTWIAAIAVIASSGLAQASTPSDAPELSQFFSTFEGHWTGKGTLTEIDFNGAQRVVRYDFSVKVNQERDNTWSTHNEIRFESNLTAQSNTVFLVQGELLFASANGWLEPVRLVEATPWALAYQIRRSEFLTGRVYDFTFRQELDGSYLKGMNTIELNGVVISEDVFNAKRW